MHTLYERVALAACGRETALIVGESGTGKELVAQAIHRQSGDPADRFVAVNCAALPRALMESELFGHARGSFSGATERRLGLARAASGGTLFFDEITELDVEAQAKLLRLIQERAVRPVGENREVPVQVRIVASTNEDLAAALGRGKLRRDLYYRLQRWVVRVPPLRDRLEDIPLLAAHFAARWHVSCGAASAPELTAAALDRLALHNWPGNVRELENVVFQACATASGRRVGVGDLPLLGEPAADPTAAAPFGPISLREAERGAIASAMAHTAGNKTMAARLLGISRKQLYVKLRLYGLGEPDPTCP
ncbi:MAG: sigma-54-dependent Fis family transcriptional regulator [Deltaproteobacteria bacterium]|nr:sigma-54-dependent Fis family transcriptional regulator [Deltaproteobacteria bacterium]